MLSIAPTAESAMRADAEAAYPLEACGLLLGAEGKALESRRAKNLNTERARDRYLMDPHDQMWIEKEAVAKGMKVLGVWHSHPDHPSAPSETDREQAEQVWGKTQSWSYLILEVAKGKVASCRSWILENGKFYEEEIR